MRMSASISCAFISHRPQKLPGMGDENSEPCETLKDTLSGLIHSLAMEGVTDFYSGIAQGADCWASEAVLTQRRQFPQLRLHCVLPFRGQELGRSHLETARCQDILDQADSVVCLNPTPCADGMYQRNRRLVESCDLLLAVYNGEHYGGTARAVNYARTLGRSILLLSPLGRAVTFENLRSRG